MDYSIALQIQDFYFSFWLGALPLLLGIWVLKRWIFDP